MALKKFTIGEMFSVTQPWVEAENPERLLLESLPGMASLMRFVELAHAGLIASQSRAESARLAALTGELGALQGRHATLARFGAGILTAYRGLHGGTDAGASLDRLAGVLFPDGLMVVRAGYLDSGGRAMVRAGILTAEHRALLATIPVQGGTLLDWLDEWNQVALRMGELANRRATPTESATERRDTRKARNHWIRVVHTVRGVIELEVPARPELQRILERIDNIDADVENRIRRASNASGNGSEGGTDDPDGAVDDANDAAIPEDELTAA